MRKLLLTLVLALSVSLVAFAGDTNIPAAEGDTNIPANSECGDTNIPKAECEGDTNNPNSADAMSLSQLTILLNLFNSLP